MSRKQASQKDLSALIDLFSQAGILKQKGDQLLFSDEKSRFFANGGWLEHYIYQTLLKYKDRIGIRDLGMSVEVSSSRGTPNEIDVAFLWNNKLHMIECKTRRFKDIDPEEGPGAETLYKMDTVRAFGGVQTKAMLVSFQTLPKWDQQRADDLCIKTIVGKDLRFFEFQLLKWVKPETVNKP